MERGKARRARKRAAECVQGNGKTGGVETETGEARAQLNSDQEGEGRRAHMARAVG